MCPHICVTVPGYRLRSPSNQSWATIPAGQVGWLLFDPQTLDIVGADVEDFEGLFLTSHPYLKVEWREVKQYVTITGRAITRGSILPPPLPDDRGVGGSVIEVIMGVMNCLTDPAHDT